MDRFLKVIGLIIYFSQTIGAQTPSFLWVKKFEGNPGSIICNNSGNINFNGYNGGGIFVKSIDNRGNQLWEATFGGGYAQSIDVDELGNVYTMGSFSGTFDFNPGPLNNNLTSSNWNVFVSKLNSNGNFVSACKFGGNGETYGYSMDVDKAGNIFTTGSFQDTSNFNPSQEVIYNLIADSVSNPFVFPFLPSNNLWDVFLSKLDPAGNFVWARQVGGKYGDRGRAICVDETGNVYALGYFEKTAKFSFDGDNDFPMTTSEGTAVFITKRDKYGYYRWVKKLEFCGINKNRPMSIDSKGNIYITGWFNSTTDFDPGPQSKILTSNGEDDIFILKLDPMGNFIWVKQIGGELSDSGNSLVIDNKENILIVGNFTNTVDFDPSEKIYNLTSSSKSVFISKFDGLGNFQWAFPVYGIGSSGTGGGSYGSEISVASDKNENVYVLGKFSGEQDFDPGIGQFLMTSLSGEEIYLLKIGIRNISDNTAPISNAGNDISAEESINVTLDGSLSYDPDGNSLTYNWTAPVGITLNSSCAAKPIFTAPEVKKDSVLTFKLVVNDGLINSELSIVKIFVKNVIKTGVKTIGMNGLKLYPNPSHGIFKIEGLSTNPQSKITIHTIDGKLIRKKITSSSIETIDISDQVSGTYLLNVSDQTYKIVKE